MFHRRSILIAVLLCCGMVLSAGQVVTSPKLADVQQPEVAVEPQSQTWMPREISEIDVLLASSDPEYVVRAGDVISVSYIEKAQQSPVTIQLQVPYDGVVRIPSIASIMAGGRKFLDVKSEIEEVLLRNNRFSEPVVSLSGLGVFSVSVGGKVRLSTEVAVNGLFRLSDVLYLTDSNSSLRNVLVSKADGSSRSYDLYAALYEGSSENNPRLEPGDRITFTKAGRTVSLSGAVKAPGSYQLVSGENLKSVISHYSDGLVGNVEEVVVYRATEGNFEKGITVPVDQDFELLDGDRIEVAAAVPVLQSVSVEGALMSTNTMNLITGNRYERYYYTFADGETVSDLLSAMQSFFIDSSDLGNASLKRNGETISLDLEAILFDGAEAGSMKLQAGDIIVIPFSQMFVSVTGAVVNPGVYGFIPGKTADYYINLAGGLSTSAKKSGDMVVRDKSGQIVPENSVIAPESVINIERSTLSSDTSNTAAILGIIASILGLVYTSTEIAVNLGSM